MYISIVILLYIITQTCCTPQNTTGHLPRKGVTTIHSRPIERPRQTAGSGRLSLINYRFNRKPKKKHLDVQELKLVLGSSYDSKFMAIEQPPELTSPDAGAIHVVKKDSWRYAEMLKELQASNLTEELQQLAGNKFTVDSEYVKIVEKWLLKRASCPVKYAWEDIGALFWPRYIRRGECSTESSTCSWPSGMHCVPSETTTIEVLRWQCRTPKGRGRKKANNRNPVTKDDKEEDKPLHMKCRWVRVPYPVTTECMCTC